MSIMGKNAQAEAPKTDEAKRNVRSDEEIIADLEAKLAAKRAKAEARKNKARDTAWEKRAKLVAKREQIDSEIEAIDKEYPQAPAEPASEDTES